jgi:hypothetical protein
VTAATPLLVSNRRLVIIMPLLCPAAADAMSSINGS